MRVGFNSPGTLIISKGGAVNHAAGSIGYQAGSNGTVEVTGGSIWNNTNSLEVGGGGPGTLTIGSGSLVTAGSYIQSSNGTLNINVARKAIQGQINITGTGSANLNGTLNNRPAARLFPTHWQHVPHPDCRFRHRHIFRGKRHQHQFERALRGAVQLEQCDAAGGGWRFLATRTSPSSHCETKRGPCNSGGLLEQKKPLSASRPPARRIRSPLEMRIPRVCGRPEASATIRAKSWRS
jgi:T5SS/PEP-CTERM-associated repeat protein